MLFEYVIAKYIRLSTEDIKSDSMSIENQRRMLDRYIEDMNIPGATILEFVDNGYSGTNFERPAVQELLALIQNGAVQCVIVKDFSRFGRNSIEVGYYLERVFPLYRTRFISMSDFYDSDTLNGETGGIDIAFKFLVHEQYSHDLSRKIKSSVDARRSRGEYIHVFFGYRKVNGKLEIDEPAAKTIRYIFKLYLEGNGPQKIAECLYKEKHRTPRAHKIGADDFLWNVAEIKKILRDERYIGTYVAGKTKILEVGSGKQIAVDRADWIRIPGHHPAIIDSAAFDAIQAGFKRRNKPNQPRKSTANAPLKGKVFCATCGHTMKPRYTADTMYCCTHTLAAPDRACHKLQIAVADLEKAVLKLLQERANSAALDTLLPASTATGEKMAIVEEEKRRLYEQLAEGTLSATEFSAANDVLTHRLTELRRTQEAVAAQADKRAFAQAAAPMKGKRKLTTAVVDALIQKVRVYPDGEIAIDWIEKSLAR